MDRMMTGAVFNIGEVTRRMRRGFIKGCHAYEAGLNQNTDHLKNKKEKEGYLMGWSGRYADEMAGLEPTVLGDDEGCFVPDEIWISR